MLKAMLIISSLGGGNDTADFNAAAQCVACGGGIVVAIPCEAEVLGCTDDTGAFGKRS